MRYKMGGNSSQRVFEVVGVAFAWHHLSRSHVTMAPSFAELERRWKWTMPL